MAYAYGQSRSGKTTYYTPVLVVGPGSDDEHTLVMHYLFWPSEGRVAELNPPSEVWNSRLSDLDNVRWDLIGPMGSPKELFEEPECKYSTQTSDTYHEHKGQRYCKSCGLPPECHDY